MKKLLLFAAILIVMIPGVAEARSRHHQPSPPPVVTPPTSGSPLKGVNYGHQLTPGTYSPSAVSADLDELKAAGITDIRIATECYDNCGGWLDMTKAVALTAKSKGFIVMWGVDSSNGALTRATWQTFLNASPDIVKWCSINRIDYCEVGNEEDDHVAKGFSPNQLRSMLRTEAATLKKLYPDQKIAYAATEPNIANWVDAGALDKVGFNLYWWQGSPFQTDVSKVKANPKGIVTEWNLDDGINYVGGNQTAYATDLVNLRNILDQAALTNYLFTLRGGANGIGNNWAVWTGTTRSPAWVALTQ